MPPRDAQPDGFSLHRARFVSFAVALVVVAAVALANLSTEPVTIHFVKSYAPGKRAERAYGWPLIWYWRCAVQYVPQSPSSSPQGAMLDPVQIRWPLYRRSLPLLAANAALWLMLLTGSVAGCQWLLRRYRPRLCFRPRALTLFAVLAAAAPMALSNLSFDSSPLEDGHLSETRYGWPLIWYWRVDRYTPFSWDRAWDFDAAAFAANVAPWLVMLASLGFACDCLLRLYPPRFRFSMKALLISVTLSAVLLAWFSAARNRVLEEGVVVASIARNSVRYEYWGPKWLDLVGAGRFRRRIIGVSVDEQAMNDEAFECLARLPSLRLIELHPGLRDRCLYDAPFVIAPRQAAALRQMRRLRMLNANCRGYDAETSRTAARSWFAAIGKLTQLESLRLSIWRKSSADLALLADLTNLKTLVVDSEPSFGSELGADDAVSVLASLPALPRLETLVLPARDLSNDNARQLLRFPALKSLDLSQRGTDGTHLAQMAAHESLEELAIDRSMATATGLRAIGELKRLKIIHIADLAREWDIEKLDDLPAAIYEDEEIRRAVAELRQSHPGIVIDARYREFRERIDSDLTVEQRP